MNRLSTLKSTVITGCCAATIIATPILAQERQRLSPECREEIMEMCATDGARDRTKIRACVRENFAKLSDTCRTEVRAMREARQKAGRE